ncbi:Uma2 family endonuclease [Steroidobacter sp. S1-65]|uniref:Uma2 family endonuclease n=1 Tax=Steroidobacter gossypii TaxID=2805490 RepID=A0ABS1X2E6_9GAMM|nr:Uma2 family endonuclease [Steroidobacter gossypii]MBM0107402.1 Uma2 family endonuclease [Steroidobacter gossypii]
MVTNAISDSVHCPHRFSVEQYYRMAEVGLLEPDARTELIEGEIYHMPPMGCRHAATVAWLRDQLMKVVGEGALVLEQYPLRLNRHTEPQPDLILARPRRGRYRDAHPTARDVLLVIEVSDSTWLYDREVKMPLYAAYGVQDAWLVDLGVTQLDCYSAPHGGAFVEQVSTRAPGTLVVPSLDVSVDLAELFSFGDQSVS